MLTIVVPAWNEAENLELLVPRIVAEAQLINPDFLLLVVDDGSTDHTDKVMARLAAEDQRIGIETLGHNHGKAGALQAGFRRALAEGATRVVMMDADGQDAPEELPQLLLELERGADLVTGARLQRRDRFVKRTTSKLYNRATATLSGAPGRDFNSGFKAMTASVCADVAPMMYGEMHRYLTVIAHSLGHRVTEVEVEHHPRMMGVSKYGLNRFWRGCADLVTIKFLLSYENRPSHLFGGLGLVSLLIGLVTLSYLSGLKLLGAQIGDRPLLLAGVMAVLVGLQLVLFGLLAELVVHNRHRMSSELRASHTGHR